MPSNSLYREKYYLNKVPNHFTEITRVSILNEKVESREDSNSAQNGTSSYDQKDQSSHQLAAQPEAITTKSYN